MKYENCKCCKVLCGVDIKPYQEKLIPLKGDWILNHYGGNDTYLGRLALATKCHIEDWKDLDTQLEPLGKNIKIINECLYNYWEDNSKEFKGDKIEQIYTVYLNEEPYKNGHYTESELKERLHVHLHILPRTIKMRENLYNPKQDLGWHLKDYVCCFPEYYQLRDEKNYLEAKRLMDYLDDCLSAIKIDETTKLK